MNTAKEITPVEITFETFLSIRNKLVEERGRKFLLISVMKRELGWTPRYSTNTNDRVFIDFWEPAAKSMFLLEYGSELIKTKIPKRLS